MRNPLLAYACLEAFIGAYALAFPKLLEQLAPLYLTVARTADLGPTSAAAFQSLVAGLLLLPPTLCMGATLPLLARFVVAEPGAAGAGVGKLYGANTLGAVAGAGLAGFALLPMFGLSATTVWAAVANGILAVAATLAGLTSRPAKEDRDPPPRERDGALSHMPLLLLLLAALTGFTGLLYEVAWFRLMSLMLGASAYAFSIMLVAFLLGIGLGGWLGGKAADRSGKRGGPSGVLRGLAVIEVGVAALSWGAMFAYGELPYAFLRLYAVAGGKGLLFWAGQLAFALALMTPPAILMGASFPYLTRAAGVHWATTPRAVGMVYGANTLGAIAGAAGGALVILPILHVRGGVALAAALNIGVAVLAMIGALPKGARTARRGTVYALAALAVIVVAWRIRPPWDPLLMTSGVFEYTDYLDAGAPADKLARRLESDQLLFYDEGPSSVVTVGKNKLDGHIWLANNGKVDASTGNDLKTQVMLAHLPFAFRPRAQNALIIGLASGITAGSVTLHPGPREIDVVEIEPAVVEASHFFAAFNHLPLDDPRVRLVIDDARRHLLGVEDGHYDLVSSEPSNPWLTGVSNLFTQEFFELGKSKLGPTGVWTQWVQLYRMAPDDLRSLLATFADVFPEVAVFHVSKADLILLGSKAALDLNSDAIDESFSVTEAVAHDLVAVGMRKAELVVAHYLFGRAAILDLAAGVERNTDDNMRIEYSAPRHLHDSTGAANGRLLSEHAVLPVAAVEGLSGLTSLAEAYVSLEMWEQAALAFEAARQFMTASSAAEGEQTTAPGAPVPP